MLCLCLLYVGVSAQIPVIDLDDPSISDTHQDGRFVCSPPIISFTIQGSNVNIQMTASQNSSLPAVGSFFLDQGEDIYTSYSAEDWLTSRNVLLTYEDMPMVCNGVSSTLSNLSPSLDVSACSRYAQCPLRGHTFLLRILRRKKNTNS